MKQARKEQAARDMVAWLPRLVGAYRYEAITYLPGTSFPPVRVAGTGECRAVGAGPRTVCVAVLRGNTLFSRAHCVNTPVGA
jgi:hypothetical protein